MRGNPDPRQGALALHGFYFLYYGLQGVSIPFLPLWFASRGLDPALIGLIVATSFLPKILSTPVVAHLADQTGRAHALIAGALAASLALFVCYPFSTAPAWLLAITLLLNAVFPAVLPLMDRMAIASGRGQGSSYTVMRACGSLGFAVVTVAGGYLIKTFDADWVMWLSILLIVACLACVRLLPRAARPAAGEAAALAVRLPMLEVLRDRPLLLCIAAASLVQASNGFLYSYSTLYWTASGLSTALISLLWVVGVASEVLFFFLAPRILARTGAQWLILTSAVMTAIRWAGLSATTDPTLIAALQLLQCFTLAGNNAAIMWYITRHVPAAIKTSAIALYALLSGGVFMFASIQLGGALYRSYAPGGFLAMSLCAIGAVPLLVYAEKQRKRAG
ncbi:MFS transporter [Achromobacter insolitus]|uniref:MFS transporter n=1 Tax=Achromobacter insolitus TaxID=217204 RepID=UPI0007C2CCE8|nr:MFS transporter [Achromobacter insolitus]AVG39093.1 MFS transporter [Achromobacter insolitus]MDH3064928.1 MFS transporter [Achromobacter insolitus]OAD15965.1 MFS transporter [Achromobacter insolitus]OAE69864.1 MFS transporter [Achromobacter insolitus]OCZ62016.1 MFS transporter [Achromobacter insolitus]